MADKLHVEIDALLRRQWNTIGQNELPDNGYSGYAPVLIALLKANYLTDKIAAELRALEERYIGCVTSNTHRNEVAQKLIAMWKIKNLGGAT